ncbi:MAG: hypothetical protein EGQ17_03170 [Lachnospiraceae bacterium]|nr:hypothetical protein [Lachnospiraceae bacterium]
MLNEEKIRLMTKAASFEAGEGKKALEMNRFYKGDYLSIHLIGAWISYTVAFCLCVGLWAFYKMEYLMTNLHKMDLAAFGKGLALLYLALLGIYLVIQMLAALFGSCGYRSAYYYDPYSYRDYSYSNSGSYANQNQTDGNTSSGSWY